MNNTPNVPVLYRLGLVDFIINRGQEPTKYYNVRLTDKGLNALVPENEMTKAPEQRDPRSLNPMKEAVPATSSIHMDGVCDEAGQPKEVVVIHGLGRKPGNGKTVPFDMQVPANVWSEDVEDDD